MWSIRSTGLSPRVRGNLNIGVIHGEPVRSIPASAGEPSAAAARNRVNWVYPRECGGTMAISRSMDTLAGLSPRVRGNPEPMNPADVARRSIPASAGEPDALQAGRPQPTVYPRECGGTPRRRWGWLPQAGLSPRVRGNPLRRDRPDVPGGSIPASAGEPAGVVGEYIIREVYPRECGGTQQVYEEDSQGRGLSPRVRGNLITANPVVGRRRSIPASAGEPT